MTRDEVISIIRSSDLGADAEKLNAELKQSIRIRAHRATGTLAIGESRLGGNPDLPRGFDWPRYSFLPKESDGRRNQPGEKPPREERYLHFVAQLRLDDFRNLDTGGLLPSSGWLYFFYDFDQQSWGFDPEDCLAWRTIFVSTANSELTTTYHPQLEDRFASQPCQVSYASEWTLPEYPLHLAKDWDWYHDLEQLQDWHEARDEILDCINGLATTNEPIHRLLGHPDHIQNDMRLECQLASNGIYCGGATLFDGSRVDSLKRGAGEDWRLLLQIDTHEDGPGWMWGDCGRIYFWIRENDLRHRAFDKIWMVLQCS